jgi:hypothetical protein
MAADIWFRAFSALTCFMGSQMTPRRWDAKLPIIEFSSTLMTSDGTLFPISMSMTDPGA